ncbi:Ger(x)C family germination protein [Caldicoprobacter guelmensis]|uniref:Ger(x)C family spore germination protein n=1 Tax=Caldicoprobacter guelmensis TaxID=1170224 RepID=UPI00195D7303|nr:Ger(x)C family spore germination protein [Caldicoprobacter guelmensis]MBM7581476.1 Ger(x)C family germination protein [Caldicoprobacter guelmensis]
MRINDKRAKILLVLIIALILTGCWDMVEIERNAFILGIGIDPSESEGGKEERIMVTYQIALPAAMLGPGGQGEGGGGQGQSSTLNVSIQAKNLIMAEQTLMATLNQVPNYDHLQLVVFGEELAKKGIGHYLDFFFRDPRIRQRTKVAVSHDKASEVFKIQPKTVKSTSQYINDLLDENEKRSLIVLMPMDFGIMQRHFIRRLDICLPGITVKKDTLTLQGAGMFRGDKLVGWLTGSDVMSLKWLHGEPAKGTIDISSDKVETGNFAFKITGNKVSIRPVLINNRFVLKVKMEVEGDIAEIQNENFNTYDLAVIRQIESLVKQKITQSCRQVFSKLVNEYKTDCIEFGRRVQNYYPDFWEKYKDDWKEYFVNSDLQIEVDVKLRRIGVIK